ncbi:MAG: wax ester/triacylglycerol synthase family O-acyltransferase, partial [Actinomycetes bacterium]
MADRLSALDASLLYLEDPSTPLHVGGVSIFAPPEGGFEYADLVDLILERLVYAPRYRQRLRVLPVHLANPVWVDDERFDLSYHVRRSALPRPGSDEQLAELVGRLMSRPLDRSRPLWEIYLVEGLSGGRFALISKSHHAVIDDRYGVDLGQLLLDEGPHRPRPAPRWPPVREPSTVELVTSALVDVVRSPAELLQTVRAGLAETQVVGMRLASAGAGMLRLLGGAARLAPASPLNSPTGSARRFVAVDTDLEAYRRIRTATGARVNDVVLAVVTGALRDWMLGRGEPMASTQEVRAMVPVAVRTAQESEPVGGRVSGLLVDLPVGEPSPLVRLARIGYAMASHEESGAA